MEAGIWFYRLLCLVESAWQPCQFIEFGLLEDINNRLQGRRASDRVHALQIMLMNRFCIHAQHKSGNVICKAGQRDLKNIRDI